MNTIRLLALLLGALLLPIPAPAAEATPVRAILITASNDRGASDPRLKAYEANLRRILRFESFRFVGEGTTRLSVPGQGRMELAQGHRLELEAEKSDGTRLRLNVRWTQGGRALLDQPLAINRGTPAILVGPASGPGQALGVILVAD
jgi:hypothetical protein